MSINNVSLVGRLVKNPELRYSQTGTAVCNFTIAINRTFKTQDGQDADFINAVIFKGGAESLANYQRKGNLIGLTGRIQTRNYENNEGKRIYVTEVVADSVQFLESKNSGNTAQNNQSNNQQSSKASNVANGNEDPFKGNGEPIDISDSDLPF